MKTKFISDANVEIGKARAALEEGHADQARKHAAKAAKINPDLEEAWLILASVSDPKKSVEFLKKALELNPQSQKARKGMHWAALRLLEIQQEFNSGSPPISKQKKKKPHTYRWAWTLFFILLITGSTLLIWFGMPVLQAQASVQRIPRPENALPKPTLTPTITPTPTMTPTPIPTPTPKPTATADTGFSSYYYHSWDIPEEVSGSNDLWVEVDLSIQMLYVYRGDQIINSFYISSGTRDHPTVTGSYKIYSKHPTYTMIGPGYHLPDVPYSMFFYKGYSLHGTYWHDNFGTPMSHGCVNMRTPDAAWLYENTTIGTYVFVHY